MNRKQKIKMIIMSVFLLSVVLLSSCSLGDVERDNPNDPEAAEHNCYLTSTMPCTLYP